MRNNHASSGPEARHRQTRSPAEPEAVATTPQYLCQQYQAVFDGLTRNLVVDGDEETRELLGLTGHS